MTSSTIEAAQARFEEIDDEEPTPGGGRGDVPKYRRAPKGQRIRFKRFLQYAELQIREDPHMDLDALAVPKWVMDDKRGHSRAMHGLRIFQQKALSGTLPPVEDGSEEEDATIPSRFGMPSRRQAAAIKAPEPAGKPAPKAATGASRRRRRGAKKTIFLQAAPGEVGGAIAEVLGGLPGGVGPRGFTSAAAAVGG